jgi:hypothetical protein
MDSSESSLRACLHFTTASSTAVCFVQGHKATRALAKRLLLPAFSIPRHFSLPILFFVPEFPESLKTQEELTEYLTVVIFTASSQHAAVNFGQVLNAVHTRTRAQLNRQDGDDIKVKYVFL